MDIKRIETREQKDKRTGRNKLIIGILLVGLLVLSTAGYAFYNTGGAGEGIRKISYNGVDFNFVEGRWYFQVDGHDFSTLYSPLEVENVSVSLTLNIQDYFNKPVYISQDSNREAVQEIIMNLGNFMERTQFVCLTGENCSGFVEKTCSDDVIMVREIGDINKSLIRQEENCVYLLSPTEDALKTADSFIFKILQIN